MLSHRLDMDPGPVSAIPRSPELVMLVHTSRVEGGCYRGNGESSYGGLEPRGELQKPLDPRWVKKDGYGDQRFYSRLSSVLVSTFLPEVGLSGISPFGAVQGPARPPLGGQLPT